MNRIIHGPNVSGQSLADRVMAAKHTITGQDLVKAVFKATTDEVMGPKRKHLDRKITPLLNDFEGIANSTKLYPETKIRPQRLRLSLNRSVV